MTPLELLAPDQRAVLELVLRQGRSYGELAELLGVPERGVRERAEAALRTLAGEPPAGADTGRIADWLLGQQTERAAAATRAQLARAPAARAWAARAAERLRALGGERTPAVPAVEADEGGAGAGRAPQAPGSEAVAVAVAGRTDGDRAAAAPPRSSRLGGAVLVGVVALALAGALAWVLTRGDGGGDAASAGSPAPAAATATPSGAEGSAADAPAATGNDVTLTGVGGSKAVGLMRLFKARGGGVQFAIGAQGLPRARAGEFYAVWFTRRDGSARLLGFPQTAVTNGLLTVGGPRKDDRDAFPRWFASYDTVLITRERSAKPSEPGAAVLAGTLPHGRAAG